MYLNFFNKVLIRINSPHSREALFLKDQYSPYVCEPKDIEADANIFVDVVSKINVGKLIFIGREAAYKDGEFYILDENKKKVCFDFDKKMVVEQGFSIGLLDVLFRSWILTLLINKNSL